MKVQIFRALQEVYPERIEGTDAWYYGQVTPCSDAEEVRDYQGKYPGTRLYLFHYPTGKVYEPFPQMENVFLEIPVYDPESGKIGLIRYDFMEEAIQAYVFSPEDASVKELATLPMSAAGDLINVRLVFTPFMLVKHDIPHDAVDFLWPQKQRVQFEENESLDLVQEGKMFTSRWIEDPEYREEIITRDLETGRILERRPGYMRLMPDGTIWQMTR